MEMNFSIYILLISCLSIIIGETSLFPRIFESKKHSLPELKKLEKIAGGKQSNITGSRDGIIKLKLSKGGEIYRKNYSDWNNVLVWKGTFNQTIDVAIKIFLEEQVFKKEIKIFEALEATKDFDIKKHRIPRVYYHGPFLGEYFAIAMTLFEETVGQRWDQLKYENKTFSDSTFLLIFKQAVESLSYIHSKNVTHNDIHLRNIFIRGKYVFIADFERSVLGGCFVKDYKLLKAWMWDLVGLRIKYGYFVSNAQIVEHFQNKIVREAFESILNTRTMNGGILPDYKQIIKISDEALAEIGRTSKPVKFEWLKEEEHASSSGESSKQ